MKTLALTESWDLTLDGAGNLKLLDSQYASAQDVATACLTIKGEHIFDQSLGIPTFETILGKRPSNTYIQGQFESCALTISNIRNALCYISESKNREIKGTITVIDSEENTARINL